MSVPINLDEIIVDRPERHWGNSKVIFQYFGKKPLQLEWFCIPDPDLVALQVVRNSFLVIAGQIGARHLVLGVFKVLLIMIIRI